MKKVVETKKKKVKNKVEMKPKRVLLDDLMPKDIVVDIKGNWKDIISEKKDDKSTFKLFGNDNTEIEPLAQETKEDIKVDNIDKIENIEGDSDNELKTNIRKNVRGETKKLKKRDKDEIEDKKRKKKKRKKKKWLMKIEGKELEDMYIKEFKMTPEQFREYQRLKDLVAQKRLKQQLK